MTALFVPLSITSHLQPHGSSLDWSPHLIGIHAGADLLTAASLTCIGIALISMTKRNDSRFNALVKSGGALLVVCAITLALDVWNIWDTDYWLAGISKALTAAVALLICIWLLRTRRRIVEVVASTDVVAQQRLELSEINERLKAEIEARTKAETDLLHTQESLQQAQELAQIGSWDWSLVDRRVTWSGESSRLLGLGSSSAMTEFDDFMSMVVEEDRDILQEAVQHAIAYHTTFDVEYRLKKRDGEIATIRSVGKPVCESTGRIVRMIGTMQDVTEVKDTERRLHSAHEKYRLLLESAPDATLVFDSEFKIEMVNSAAEGVFGYCRSELIGKDVSLLMPPEKRAQIEWIRDHYLRDPERAPTGRIEHLRFSKKDGATFPGEASIRPKRFDSSVLVTCVIRDVGARLRQDWEHQFLLQASDSLNEKMTLESRLEGVAKLLVSAMADWCVVDIIDEKGKISRISVVHINPFKAELAKELREKFIPADRPGDWIGSALRTGRPKLVSEAHLDAICTGLGDGRQAEIVRELDIRSYMVVPLFARGRVIGALTFVTSSRKYEPHDLDFAQEVGSRVALFADNVLLLESAQRAVRARDDLIAVVSHDLKNPMSNIGISLKLIKRLVDDDESGRAEAKVLISKTETILNMAHRLLTDLLDLAKLEAGRMTMEKSHVDMSLLFSRCADLLAPLADQKEISLRFRFPTERWKAYCDGERISQVLSNLVGNAIKFTPANGIVEVSVAREPRRFVIAVADTGPGIPPEHLPHLFDRYWQSKETAKLGTGLGLSICRGIVEAHGGRIWVRSEQGMGSTFTFSLPAAEITMQPMTQPSTKRVEEPAH